MKMSSRVLLSILACWAMGSSISGCNDSNSSASSATIGGTVTGLSGSVTLVNNGRDSQIVSADGTFTFPTRQGESSPYAVAVFTQPAGQTCTVTNGSGTVGTANIVDVAVGCVADTFTLGGTVSGLSGTVVLQRAGGEQLSISRNGEFVFPTAVAEGSTYEVSVKTQPVGGTCTVTRGSGVVGSSSVASIMMTCLANAFTTGGTISGLIGTVVLQNNGAGNESISSDGAFTFATPVTQGKSYAVTILSQPTDQTCSVGSGSGTMGGTKVTNVVVVCSTNTFGVGGTASGLIGSVVLQDNGGDALTLSVDGAFVFTTPVAQGGMYAVAVLTQPATETCTVANGSGTVGSGKVSSVALTCATNAYTVGGTVSGLNGALTLQDNGGSALPLGTNGSFSFPMPVAEGSTYDVTIETQPAVQTCTVTNNAGTMGNSNTTNVSVTCATNDTTLTVTASAIIGVNSSSGTLTVTNTGTYTAANVAAMLPAGWTAVTQDATGCTAIAPNGGSCTLSFTSTAPYVAQGGIIIAGDNISAPPSTALAFTLNGYLVFSVDSLTSASVIDTADLTVDPWGSDTVATGALSLTDGLSNTLIISSAAGIGASTAVDCNNSTNGGAVPGTWYLPAICQMGPAGQGASCPTGLGNMDTLMQLGFAQLSQFSWSSTEYSTSGGWVQLFYPAGNSYQASTDKSFVLSARCVRSLAY